MLKKQLFRRLFITGFILSIITLQVQSSSLSSPELIKSPEPINIPDFKSAPKDNQGRFTNPEGDISHGSLSVRLRFYLRRFGTLFRSDAGAPKIVANQAEFLRDNSSTPTVTWIGHATLLVQMEGVNFLTDPIWSQTPSPLPPVGPSRWVDPGMTVEELPAIDFVVISHNHFDHLDLPTLRKLAARNSDTVFFVPLGNADLLLKNDITQVQELDWGQTAPKISKFTACPPSTGANANFQILGNLSGHPGR
jgi:N-acyl-phosphatidylethanolamine-hydrolysing phospholipase D